MSDFLAGKAVRKLNKGMRTVSNSLAIANGVTDMFTVVGGSIFAHQLVGRVTTQIGAATTTCRVRFNPDLAATINLAAVVSIAGHDVGTMYSITGTAATLQTSAQVLATQAREIMLPTGTVAQVTSAARAGRIVWELFYTPIDDGAYVVAV